MDGSLSPMVKFGFPAIALAIGGIGAGFAVHEHNSAQELASQNTQVSAQLSATDTQLHALSAKVSELNAADQAREAAEAQRVAAAGSVHVATHHFVYDPRYKKLQSQVDDQGKAIDQARADLSGTQTDLSTARTELGGSIARTHDELVLLQRRGERNYVEFDISRSKSFQRTGPISIALRKSNVKHQYADLQLMVDDRSLTQKHVNLFQPAMFYQPDSPQPIEIVINSISKNHIHGYISAPKYRQSELAAMSTPATNPAQDAVQSPDQQSNTNGQPATRQKLPTPKPDDTNN
jgi:hypothetical protein